MPSKSQNDIRKEQKITKKSQRIYERHKKKSFFEFYNFQPQKKKAKIKS